MSQPVSVSKVGRQPVQFHRTPRRWLQTLWKFSRPHTIIGTSLSVLGLYAIGMDAAWESLGAEALILSWLPLLLSWLACLGGNVYIVGLNQLEDIAIDRINKPSLPLASGEFTPRQGRWIVGVTGVSAVAIALTQGRFLTGVVVASLIIGTAYSLPPIRLKRFPVWASLCILTVRGAIVNLGLFLHFADRLGLPLVIPARVWALTAFILVFSIVIAIFKDIPDLEGDRQFNITTFTLRLGQRRVFNLAVALLAACYIGLMIVSLGIPHLNVSLSLISHSFLLGLMWYRSRPIARAESKRFSPAYPAFYQFIWKLFFLEYLLFPLTCWLAN